MPRAATSRADARTKPTAPAFAATQWAVDRDAVGTVLGQSSEYRVDIASVLGSEMGLHEV